MQVTLLSNGDEISVELDNGSTVRQVLDLAKIHPSTVIVKLRRYGSSSFNYLER